MLVYYDILTFIPRVRVEYKRIDIQRGTRRLFGSNHFISNKREWNDCFIINAPKYRQLKSNTNKNDAYAYHICREWYHSYAILSRGIPRNNIPLVTKVSVYTEKIIVMTRGLFHDKPFENVT